MIGKICVSIGAPTVAAALDLAAGAGEADVVEIRLDTMRDAAIPPFAALGRPLLFTNRAGWEGGAFSGPEEARIAPLVEAVSRGFWADIELSAPEASRTEVIAAAGEGARVLVSWHDFDSTPEHGALRDILARMAESGADVGKVVTMARSAADVLRVLSLLAEAADRDFPLVAFCMGEAGRISRVATLFLGGFMTYAAPDGGGATAPGQMSLAAMRRIVREME